ncbi:MAG: hypothetical protein ACYC5Q_16765 [Thermoleophilia bacterium]
MDELHYSFWPDTEGYAFGTAEPVPGLEEERRARVEAFSREPIDIHPTFLGGWVGRMTKETSSLSATRFFLETSYFNGPRVRRRYDSDVEGIVYGPDIPYARIYGLPSTQPQAVAVRAAWDAYCEHQPEYSWEKRSFCTSLVVQTLLDVGIKGVKPLRRWATPEVFRKSMDRLAEEDLAKKKLAVIGAKKIGMDEAEFYWIHRLPQNPTAEAVW